MLFNKTGIKRICKQRQSSEVVDIINKKCKDYLHKLIEAVVKITYYCNRKTIWIDDVKIIINIIDCKTVIYGGDRHTLTLYKPFDTYIRSLIGTLRLAKGVSRFLLHIIENKVMTLLNMALFSMHNDRRETLLSKDFLDYNREVNIDFNNPDIIKELAIKYIKNAVILTKYANRITIDCAPIKILTCLWADSYLIEYSDKIWDDYENGDYKNKNINYMKKLFSEYKYTNQKIGLTGLIYLTAIIEKIILEKYDPIFVDFLFI